MGSHGHSMQNIKLSGTSRGDTMRRTGATTGESRDIRDLTTSALSVAIEAEDSRSW